MDKSLFLIILLVICCSCHKETERTEVIEPVLIKYEKELDAFGLLKLKGEKLGINDSRLLGIYDMLVLDNILILCRPYASPTYYELFSLTDLKHLRSYGDEGQGPGEFGGVLRTVIVDREKKVLGLVPQGFQNVYYELNLDSVLRDDDYNAIPKFTFDIFGINRLQKLSGGNFAVLGLHLPGRLAVLDSMGRKITDAVSYPFEAEMNHINKQAWGLAFQSEMIRNHSMNRIGIFCYESPCWDIISFENEAPEVVQSVHLRKPRVTDKSEIGEKEKTFRVSISSKNKEAFIDVTSTDNYIYALYSGKSYQRNRDQFGFSKQVLVFNWEGALLTKLELEEETKMISVVNDEYLLSLVESVDDTQLIKYTLPKLD